jgi:hypothetical protein
MKKCNVCEIEKLEIEFYKGYAKCKKCFYEVVKKYRATEKGKEIRRKETLNSKLSGKNRERQKRYELTKKSKEVAKKYEKKRYSTLEGKARLAAKNAVRYALRKGKLIKMNCIVCGNTKSQAHHPSYAADMRLNVVWLCSQHHNEIHNPGAM